MVMCIRAPLCRPLRPKRKWHCRHWQAATEWATSHVPTTADLQGLTEYAKDVQVQCGDKRTCAQRRQSRNPYEVKLLASWAALSPDPARRSLRRRHVCAARRRVARREDAGRRLESIRRGKVEGRNIALMSITSIDSDGVTVSDAFEINASP